MWTRGLGFKVWTQTTKGILRDSEETEMRPEVREEDLKGIAWWKKRAVGIVDEFFPNPKEWRFEGLDAPLDEVTVKSYTSALQRRASIAPSCLAAWAARIGELPTEIGERYSNSLLTPRDWSSHFKNVLHRTLTVRSITTGEPCRCCLAERENLQHFAHCPKLILLWKQLHEMTKAPALQGITEWERFCLFALHPSLQLSLGWINLHLLLRLYGSTL